MKIIPIRLLEAIQSPVAALSICWLITRRDGVVQGFTDAQDDLVIDGQRCQAITGFEPSAIESTATMSVDNLEINGLLNSGAIRSADVHAGIYGGAQVRMFYVDRSDIAAGTLPVKKGYIGNISYEQGKFSAEIRGVLQPYSQSIIELCSKTCRATLGDHRCKVSLTPFTVTGTVAEPQNSQRFKDAGRTEEAGYFTNGQVRFTSGACAGLSIEVKFYSPGVVQLSMPMPRLLAEGDTYVMTAGCDRTVETCADRFNNVLNFRGEPFVPDPAVTAAPAS
jgi:uncharacterized phage protein (TIGR02218 family)